MKIGSALLLSIMILMAVCNPVQASDTPPLDITPIPATQPAPTVNGFPWALVVIFIIAGFIMTYLKKDNPNKITTNCCVPLIDEKKMGAEKKQIAEEEASLKKL